MKNKLGEVQDMHLWEGMCVNVPETLEEPLISAHGSHCDGARGWGLPLCAITIVVLRRGYSYPAAPSVSQTVSVCVVNGVTCLFGSDPPLFFYLLCFSDSLWTSSLLLLPIAYLPSILLYDNKSMWVNNDFSQIQQDNWILPHSFLITQKSN